MVAERSEWSWQMPSASRRILFSLCMAPLLLPLVAQQATDAGSGTPYGVDGSWPMQHESDSHPHYQAYMNGCYDQGYKDYEKRPDGMYQRKAADDPRAGIKDNNAYIVACNNAEKDRLEMNLHQPKEMQNYTHAGYAKVDTPPEVLELLKNFWETNKGFLWPEFWNEGNTYVNHWEAPTNLLDIGRRDVPYRLKKPEYETIIRSIQDVLESWTNEPLVLTSAYGIRVYQEGAILAPHVDRLPLVSSAIINVFQTNVTEPWILEVIGHDGKAHNLTSEPGEMLLYESASVIHGRPYPLQGKEAMYGSLFVHFEPLYHSLRQAQKTGNQHDGLANEEASKNAFEKALQEQLQKPTLREKVKQSALDRTAEGAYSASSSEAFRKSPPYVWADYGPLYDQRFYFDYEETVFPKTKSVVFGTVTVHQAASLGQLKTLKQMVKDQGRNLLFKEDHNGWRPLHEAARSGQAEVVEYLLKEGAKVNERTNFNEGGNALYWAKKKPTENAKAIAVLEKYGGVVVAPRGVIAKRIVAEEDKEKPPEKDKKEK